MTYKEKIVNFVGKEGFVAFEHGFKPNFNCWGVSDTEVYQRGKRIPLEKLEEEQARTLYIDLLEYFFYCIEKA